MPELTTDSLLGGRVTLHQPRTGYRVSSDAVLLAALAPVRPGATLLELGTGYGQVALCVAARVPDCTLTGVELLPEVAALAAENVELNNQSARIKIISANVRELGLPQRFEGVLANPPYRQVAGHDLSPLTAKNYANYEMDGVTLAMWADAAARHLLPHGWACFIHDAARRDDLAEALRNAGLSRQQVLPLVPHAGEPPHRVAIMAERGPEEQILLPALVQHEADGRWTATMEAVLRHADALPAFDSHFRENEL